MCTCLQITDMNNTVLAWTTRLLLCYKGGLT